MCSVLSLNVFDSKQNCNHLSASIDNRFTLSFQNGLLLARLPCDDSFIHDWSIWQSNSDNTMMSLSDDSTRLYLLSDVSITDISIIILKVFEPYE